MIKIISMDISTDTNSNDTSMEIDSYYSNMTIIIPLVPVYHCKSTPVRK